ncbi:MAG: hypothetical protein ACRDPG_07320 [Nocardioidaceae bacterium]
MVTANRPAQYASFSERMHVRRSRGAVSGVLLILLGAWGGLIPFIGPTFSYAYTPDDSWHFTMGRLWLEILPGAAAVLGGLILLIGAHRAITIFGCWLAAVAGAWFVVGPVLSTLWNGGVPAAGVPASADTTQAAMEQIGFFSGLGVVILFLASVSLGRMSIVGVSDLARTAPAPVDEPPATEGEGYSTSSGNEAREPVRSPARDDDVSDEDGRHTTERSTGPVGGRST